MVQDINAFDPILSLASSIYSGKGVYALLLGSGISRAAGIPTGWEITLDLVRQLAAMSGEDTVQDLELWYFEKYGKEPDYCELINNLARTEPARRQLLRQYFEPTPEEVTQNTKQPTSAHQKIAELVANGYVKVILTTNFDRLLEKALEERGISPTVISTSSQIRGAIPLVHTDCTIIKLHGDYLNSEIKNTALELSKYNSDLNRLLDRILDEYGLIVCGWSGRFDEALKSAIERCKSRRFTTYWAEKGIASDEAISLQNFRSAQVIKIESADSFFKELSEKVLALEAIEPSRALSAQVAAERIRKYLRNNDNIGIDQLFIQETKNLRVMIGMKKTRLEAYYSPETLSSQFQLYSNLTSALYLMTANLIYYGGKSVIDEFRRSLDRVAADSLDIVENAYEIFDYEIQEPWLDFESLPVMFMIYAAGISACLKDDYALLYQLLHSYTVKTQERLESDPVYWINKNRNEIEAGIQSAHNRYISLLRRTNMYTYGSLSHALYDTLMPIANEFGLNETSFRTYFDRFEYLLALECEYLRINGNEIWRNAPSTVLPLFCIRDYITYSRYSAVAYMDMLIKANTYNIPLINAGFFGSNFDTFKRIKAEFDEDAKERIEKLRH